MKDQYEAAQERQEKISRVVRIGQKAGGANCISGSTLESADRVELSPNLPKADDQIDSQHSSDCSPPKEETKAREVAVGVKRPAAKTPEESLDFSGEMQKMLESFGSDINKTLSAKKQRLEKLTTTSLKSTNKKVEDSWKVQQIERQKLYDDFQKQTLNVLQQWELDLEKAKENEEKLTNLLRQQQKLFQQTRVVQSQRLRTIKELHEQYTKGLEDLEKNHLDQQTSVQGELRKEMALLQKKILMDTQQQEMASVRKSLQTMLF